MDGMEGMERTDAGSEVFWKKAPVRSPQEYCWRQNLVEEYEDRGRRCVRLS